MNVLTKRLITIRCDSRLQSDIVWGKNIHTECPFSSRLSCLHIPYSTPYSFLSIAFCSYFLTFLLFSKRKFCVPLIFHNLLLISSQQHSIISFCAVVFLFVMFKDVTANLSSYPFLITQPPPSTHSCLYCLWYCFMTCFTSVWYIITNYFIYRQSFHIQSYLQHFISVNSYVFTNNFFLIMKMQTFILTK